jgi:hypothetical protein
VQIVPGLVLALMLALRTTDIVSRVDGAIAVSEIAKKKNLGLALLAGSYDVPGSILRFERHRGHFFLPRNNLAQTKTLMSLTKATWQTRCLSFCLPCDLRLEVCTVADISAERIEAGTYFSERISASS